VIGLGDRMPLVGGVATAVLCLASTIGLGAPGDWEALQRLEAIQPTLRFLSSTTITAAATILALMLTLLGLSASSKQRLKEVYYLRIRRIAGYATFALIGSLFFLLLLIIPIEESDSFPEGWFDKLYYGMLGAASLFCGCLSVIVFMLYGTISDLVDVVGLGKDDHPMVHQPSEEE
jgi:hypothetical protein